MKTLQLTFKLDCIEFKNSNILKINLKLRLINFVYIFLRYLVLPSKLDWFPSTIEAFWKNMGAYGFSRRLGILREST